MEKIMPKYVVSSEGPITVKQVERPDLPDIGSPENPWVPGGEGIWGGGIGRPGHGLPPSLPPRDEWPPLPPGLQPGVGLPIPPTPEFPMVPIDPDPDMPEIWPPVRPEFPDLSGKTLALALIFVSRHVAKWHWVVIDHEEAKKKWNAIKGKLPAGGIGGRPPARPGGPA
jgi:hypothetical protein